LNGEHTSIWCCVIMATLGIAFLTGSIGAHSPDSDYVASVEKWREGRRSSLLAEDGYLAVSGLFWLKEGESTFGSDPANDFVLPAESAPDRVGVFEHHGGKTRVRIEPGVEVTMNGKPVQRAELKSSRPGPPDILRIGDLALNVHSSGQRYGIRLRDKNSKFRKEFTSLRWYPIDPDYCVTADFVPFDEMKTIQLLNIMGDLQDYQAPGYVTFELKGQKMRLDPVMRGKQLFFIFRDRTSGRTTYPAARFLYADMPVDGKVVVDFNKAINPACAFSPYTACPYPPEQNRMRVPIEAGAMKYLGGGGH
jgi:uncharacterized protein (DUF1684 family)